MSTSRRACLSAFGLLVVALGCAWEYESASSSTASGYSDTGGDGFSDAAEPTQTSAQGSNCPMDHLTRACSCRHDGGQLPGRQVCAIDSGWLPCECITPSDTTPATTRFRDAALVVQDVDLSANKGNERFYWKRTEPTDGSTRDPCLSGEYEGTFDGFYNNFIPVLGPVGLKLNESANGEFLEVSGGTMGGSALIVFPFQGDITGSLDCEAAYFDGYIKNGFRMNPAGTDVVPFEGYLRAQYDSINHAFINGVWSVTEPDGTGAFPTPPDVQPGMPLPALPPKGGVGNWSAILK